MPKPFISEKTGSLVTKRDVRRLPSGELLKRKWLNALTRFLNKQRNQPGKDAYNVEQIERWLKNDPDAFIVIVKKTSSFWSLSTENIVATCRTLPLAAHPLTDLQPSPAEALWLSEIHSDKQYLFMLCSALSARLKNSSAAIYCESDSSLVQHIFARRFGVYIIGGLNNDKEKTSITM